MIAAAATGPPNMNVPCTRLAPLLIVLLLGWRGGDAVAAAAKEEPKGGPLYAEVDELNVGLPAAPGVDLGTPQAALENFILSCDRRDYAAAAHSLNLNAIPAGRQAEEGEALARRLKEVMDRQVWFRWDEVPDRPDGRIDEASLKRETEGRVGPQSSIKLATLYIGERDFEVRLERVKPVGGPPAWVFSRQTVGHVPALHAEFGPSRIERYVPSVLKRGKFAKVRLWQWIGFALFVGAGVLLGWLADEALGLAARLPWPWIRTIAEALRGPGSMVLGLWTFYFLARSALGLAGPILTILDPLCIAVLVASLVWFLRRLITFLSERICGRYAGCATDEANALITRIEVVRHVLAFAVLLGGALFALSRFEWFREVGVMVLASAGVAGLVLGVAAHRVLGNLFAGLLLALAQPVKSGDAVIFEGEFGWVEEITLTYLVVRTWDQRRLVVPIVYFLDRPVQNWSRKSRQLMMPLVIYADYRIDVEAVRSEFRRIMEESEEWDRSVPPILQVTDCKEGSIELRALCSTSDPTSSWNLRCRVRERLVAFVQGLEGGRYLPRSRVLLVDDHQKDPGADGPGRIHGDGAAGPANGRDVRGS
jgi:small-conductance mechanosensitive channel